MNFIMSRCTNDLKEYREFSWRTHKGKMLPLESTAPLMSWKDFMESVRWISEVPIVWGNYILRDSQILISDDRLFLGGNCHGENWASANTLNTSPSRPKVHENVIEHPWVGIRNIIAVISVTWITVLLVHFWSNYRILIVPSLLLLWFAHLEGEIRRNWLKLSLSIWARGKLLSVVTKSGQDLNKFVLPFIERAIVRDPMKWTNVRWLYELCMLMANHQILNRSNLNIHAFPISIQHHSLNPQNSGRPKPQNHRQNTHSPHYLTSLSIGVLCVNVWGATIEENTTSVSYLSFSLGLRSKKWKLWERLHMYIYAKSPQTKLNFQSKLKIVLELHFPNS